MDEESCPICGYEEAIEVRYKQPGDDGDRFGCRECGGEFIVSPEGDLSIQG